MDTSDYEYYFQMHNALERLKKLDIGSNYDGQLQETWKRMQAHKGAAPTPIAYVLNPGGYIRAGYLNKLVEFRAPDNVDADGFEYAFKIFQLGVSVSSVLTAHDLVGDCKNPSNELRDRMKSCANDLTFRGADEVATLLKAPVLTISNKGKITFNKPRSVQIVLSLDR